MLERGLKQRVQALNAFLHDIYHEQRFWRRARVPGRARARQHPVPPRDAGHQPARQHLRPHRRRRSRPRRRRRVVRARGQPAGAVRRVVHAREPQDDDAAAARAVRRAVDPAGAALSRHAAQEPARRLAGRRGRADRRGADARRLQFGVLRARVPRAADGRASWSKGRICSCRTTRCSCTRRAGPSACT